MIGSLFTLNVTASHAAPLWQYVGQSGSVETYLDSNYTLCGNCYDRDQVYLQWTKNTGAPGQLASYRSNLRDLYPGATWTRRGYYDLALYAFDCQSQEIGSTNAAVYYDINGRTLRSFSKRLPVLWEWSSPIPDSIGEEMLNIACEFGT
jgi:hypothetical protein